MVVVTIDNIHAAVVDNITIIQACKYLGIKIPRFCYHEILPVAGNCRMCLIEFEHDEDKIHVACATLVADKVKIFTNSFLIQKVRENILELLLINHPLDCPICDQGGECDLQDQAKKYGTANGRLFQNKRFVSDKYFNILIKTIMNRCIHCTRCVRFVESISKDKQLGTINRGNHTEISTYFDKKIFSEVLGNVIDLCPVGALTSKFYAFKTRPWELQTSENIDITDGLGVKINLHFKDRVIYRILPKLSYESNLQIISDKTRFSFDAIKENRIVHLSNNINANLTKNWSNFLHYLNDVLKYTSMDKFLFILGENTSLETIRVIKNLERFFDYSIVKTATPAVSNSNYIYNIPVSFNILKSKSLHNCFLLSTNIRCENALINFRLKTKYLNNNLFIFSFGSKVNSDFNINFININPSNTIKFFEGKNKNVELLKSLLFVNKPIILVGENFKQRYLNNVEHFYNFLRKLNPTVEIFPIFKNINIEGLNNNNIKFISKKNLMDSKYVFTTYLDDTIFLRKLFSKNKMADKISFWFNTHYSKLAQNFNFLVPIQTHFEEASGYLNFEKKYVTSVASIKSFGDSKSLYLIFSYIFTKKTIFYLTLKDMLELQKPFEHFTEMVKNIHLYYLLNIKFLKYFNKASFASNYSFVMNYPFKVITQDFYLTNLYTKNSYNMIKASKEFRSNYSMFENK